MSVSDRDQRIARVLRPLGTAPMSREQAKRAGQLLGLHWTSVYRLRSRYLQDPVMSSLSARASGPEPGLRRLDARAEAIVDDVLERWLPSQRVLAHPPLSVNLEVRRRCGALGIAAPSRTTLIRRLADHRKAEAAALATRSDALIPPGLDAHQK
jgi:putative transposase